MTEFSFAGQAAVPPSPALLRRMRRMADLKLAEVAAEIGLSIPRVCILEHQRTCTAGVAGRYLRALAALQARKRSS